MTDVSQALDLQVDAVARAKIRMCRKSVSTVNALRGVACFEIPFTADCDGERA